MSHTMTARKKTEIIPLERIQVRPNAVVYRTLSCSVKEGESQKTYETTVIDGKSTYCTCGHHVEGHAFCKHMNAYQRRERERAQERERTFYLQMFNSCTLDSACY